MKPNTINGVLNYPLRNDKSKIHGTGAFALGNIPGKKKIGSLGGQIISIRLARQRVKATKAIAMVELNNNKAIDASYFNEALRYVNHSCKPNTYMRVFNYHVEFYSLRAIKKGEELTCNYGLTHHDGKQKCGCGQPGCVGFI
ncbi:MAG: hypothetical protein RLZZ367_2274 [Bacteroidota bacterium]|jgi:SET domain-containing protein